MSGSVGLTQPAIDGDDIYWIEMRPSEGGRQVIVKRDRSGRLDDINPQPFNARTRVHEYGGGEYHVSHGTIYFSNFTDQRLYRQKTGTRNPNQSLPKPTCDTQKLFLTGREVDWCVCGRTTP